MLGVDSSGGQANGLWKWWLWYGQELGGPSGEGCGVDSVEQGLFRPRLLEVGPGGMIGAREMCCRGLVVEKRGEGKVRRRGTSTVLCVGFSVGFLVCVCGEGFL